MGTYEEKMRAVASADAKVAAARAERDEKEIDDVIAAKLEKPEDRTIVRFKDAPPDIIGHVVIERPKASAVEQFRSIMWRDTSKGAASSDVKATAGRKLLAACVVWPPLDDGRLDVLVKRCNGVIDAIAAEAMKLAAAGAEAEEKE